MTNPSPEVTLTFAGQTYLARIKDGKPQIIPAAGSSLAWRDVTRMQLPCGNSIPDTILLDIIRSKIEPDDEEPPDPARDRDFTEPYEP
jgi:hypothetical protein